MKISASNALKATELFLEKYYFKNLTLSEISNKYNISRNAIHKQIKISEEKLIELEKVLKINKKDKLLKEIIDNIKDESVKDKLNKINDRM